MNRRLFESLWILIFLAVIGCSPSEEVVDTPPPPDIDFNAKPPDNPDPSTIVLNYPSAVKQGESLVVEVTNQSDVLIYFFTEESDNCLPVQNGRRDFAVQPAGTCNNVSEIYISPGESHHKLRIQTEFQNRLVIPGFAGMTLLFRPTPILHIVYIVSLSGTVPAAR